MTGVRMRARRGALAAGIAVLGIIGLVGCSSEPGAASEAVAFTVFTNGNQESPRPYGELVRDRNTLLDVLAGPDVQLTFDRYPWRQDAAVIIFGGPQPTPGYRIVVDGLRQSGDRLIAVAHAEPPTDGMQPQVVAHPYTVLQVRQSDVADVRSVSVIWKS